jgi:hypothetical protein
MKDAFKVSRGRLVSAILAGSWRQSNQPPLGISQAQFDEVAPLLYGCGGAALGWWRIRETSFRETPSGELLRQAFRLQTLFAKIHQSKTAKIVRLLRAAGIESIVIKGWSAARHYPQTGLRPSGDIDVLVRPRDYPAALQVVESNEASDCWVDLHASIFELADRRDEDLFFRSKLIACGDDEVRVLAAEDELALLAVHWLKHGAWRPLSLCDIGLLLESMSDDFDWDLCLGRNKRRINWILSAAGLAHELVDAQISNEEIAARSGKMPDWLVPAVLKQWDTPFAINQPPMNHLAPMSSYLRHPRNVFRDLARRWPDPILGTISVNGQFNGLPRFPYQVGNIALRAVKFLWHLPQTGS